MCPPLAAGRAEACGRHAAWTRCGPWPPKSDLLPRVHGSGLFTRGQTQVLTVATLGPVSDAQMLDGIDEDEEQALYAPVQLPLLLCGRDPALPGPRTPGNRPRRSGGAGSAAGAPFGGGIPLRHAGWSPRCFPPTAPPPRLPSAAPPWR